jgi:hypothetical protein
MSLIVRAFPLRSSVGDLEAFASELRDARKAEAAEFYRRYGIWHESWHLQETPTGHWVIGITAIDDAPEAAPRYARSSTEFDRWFKKRVMDISGVDPDSQPLGPPTTEVFVWTDEVRPGSNLWAKRPAA